MPYSLRNFFMALPFKLCEEDKIKHMVWSFCTTLIALGVMSTVLAFGTVFLLGLAKECWDKYYGSGFCFYDVTGNLIGILAGLLCGFMLRHLLATLFSL